jgi:hypothetical protein
MENEKKGQLFTHLCTITTNKHAASHMLHVWTAFQLAIHDMEHLVHEQYSNCSIPISLYIYYVGAEYLIHRVSCFCILVLLCIPNMQGLSRCILQSDLRHGRLMGAID